MQAHAAIQAKESAVAFASLVVILEEDLLLPLPLWLSSSSRNVHLVSPHPTSKGA